MGDDPRRTGAVAGLHRIHPTRLPAPGRHRRRRHRPRGGRPRACRCSTRRVGGEATVETTEYDLGARRWHATGETLPDTCWPRSAQHDAILLGAVGDPERARAACWSAGCCCGCGSRWTTTSTCARPGCTRASPPRSPTPGAGIDFVVVREGTEGPYVGNGGALRTGTPHEIATEVSVNTAFGVERVVRDAFARAAARPRRQAHPRAQAQRAHPRRPPLAAHRRGASTPTSPTSTTDYLHVDAATIFLVTDPARFDVIVTDNLFGDILTDLAAAITGGIGLAASGNINPDRTAPSMFEPVHGSAPDIAGQGKADPTATVLSVAMLLDHLGLDEAAEPRRAGRRGRPGRPRRPSTPAHGAGRRRDSPRASPAEPLARGPPSRRHRPTRASRRHVR